MDIVYAVLPVAALLILAELWSRKKGVEEESSRKFVHIAVGSYVAFWPFFLEWNDIRILSMLFLLGVAGSMYFGLFRAIHSVQRPTWGEVFFALAVGALTLVTEDKLIYAAALLQMSLADGLAALIGIRFGKSNSYLVFGYRKSIAGTATFLAVSILVLIGFDVWGGASIGVAQIIGIAALATAVENLGVKGLDNLLVPLGVGVLITQLL